MGVPAGFDRLYACAYLNVSAEEVFLRGALYSVHILFINLEPVLHPPEQDRRLRSRGRVKRFSAHACLGLLLLVCSSLAAMAQVNFYTKSYDTSRTGANLQETILTPANVTPSSFGKLFTVPTDGQIYTQPLYVSNLAIAGGTHNVVFVGSMFNTLYAIDADNGTVYWTQNSGSEIIAQDVENDNNIS